jgi:hypothetical protein
MDHSPQQRMRRFRVNIRAAETGNSAHVSFPLSAMRRSLANGRLNAKTAAGQPRPIAIVAG